MNDTTNKKPYIAPQVFRVELSHEQAVISTCSTTAGNAMAGGAGTGCRSGGCKFGAAGGSANNAGRMS
jgi:hypothetical protein